MHWLLSWLRGLVLLAMASAAGYGAWRLCIPSVDELVGGLRDDRSIAGWPVDRLVTDLAAAAALLAVAGLAVSVVLAVVSALAAVRFPALAAVTSRLTPGISRRLVTVTLGIGLVATPATVAGVATAQPQVSRCHTHCAGDAPRLDGLPFPDLPTQLWRTGRVDPGHPPEVDREHRLVVVVRAGDSLWRIAERLLPADASPAEVASLTTRLYRLNRHTIGADPDLLFPGMSPHAPEGTS